MRPSVPSSLSSKSGANSGCNGSDDYPCYSSASRPSHDRFAIRVCSDDLGEGNALFHILNFDADLVAGCCVRDNDDEAAFDLCNAVTLITTCFDRQVTDLALLDRRVGSVTCVCVTRRGRR